LTQYEGKPDCYVSLSLKVLPRLSKKTNITLLIKQGLIELDGDIQLAQKFFALFSNAKPDVEEWLSQWIGDATAHSMVRIGKQCLATVKYQGKKRQEHLSQVLIEEWKISPGALEIAYFCEQVDDINTIFTRLESRMNAVVKT